MTPSNHQLTLFRAQEAYSSFAQIRQSDIHLAQRVCELFGVVDTYTEEVLAKEFAVHRAAVGSPVIFPSW